MIPDGARDVVLSLVARTKDGQVRWRPGIAREREFLANFPNSSVRVTGEGFGSLGTGEPRYVRVQIIDERGEPVLAFSSDGADTDIGLLRELFQVATTNLDDRASKTLDYLRHRLAVS